MSIERIGAALAVMGALVAVGIAWAKTEEIPTLKEGVRQLSAIHIRQDAAEEAKARSVQSLCRQGKLAPEESDCIEADQVLERRVQSEDD